jgi:hypothetical protein
LNSKTLAELRGVRTPPPAKHFDFARIRRRQTLADFDGCRFSCAIRSKQAETPARLHFEVEAVDCNYVFIRFPQLTHAQG